MNNIRGLTLHRPWPWAITCLDKRIENRSWKPSIEVGDYLAIHAGETWDEIGRIQLSKIVEDSLFDGMVPSKRDCPTGIVAVAKYGGLYDRAKRGPCDWFKGPYGWILDEVVPLLEPVSCRGSRGLWEIDNQTLGLLRFEWDRSRKYVGLRNE